MEVMRRFSNNNSISVQHLVYIVVALLLIAATLVLSSGVAQLLYYLNLSCYFLHLQCKSDSFTKAPHRLIAFEATMSHSSRIKVLFHLK